MDHVLLQAGGSCPPVSAPGAGQPTGGQVVSPDAPPQRPVPEERAR